MATKMFEADFAATPAVAPIGTVLLVIDDIAVPQEETPAALTVQAVVKAVQF